MIQKIKQKFQKEEHKRLLSNFISLSILQGANYLLPLLTFPYLVRVLGVEKFGLISFAGATIAYFNILTDFGFNLTATKEVSIYKNDKNKLSEIFSSVITIKLLLLIFSFFILYILVFSLEKFSTEYILYFVTYGSVIGQAMFPQWFFQGMERMKYITILNILSRVIFTIAIFLFIHEENDYWKVPLINSLGYIMAGILALYIIFKDFEIKFQRLSIYTLKKYLFNNFYIFLSNIGISLYTIITPFFLGLFTNNTVVGSYSIIEKLINIIRQLYMPFNQVIFPYFMSLFHKNKTKAFKQINIIALLGGFLLLFVITILILVKKQILLLLFGKEIFTAYVIDFFEILIFVPIFTFWGSLYLMNAMIALDLKVIRNKIIYTIGFFYVVSLYILLQKDFLMFPYLYLFTEFLISFFSFIFTWRSIIYKKNNNQ